MNLDILGALRTAAGRQLIAAGRRLSRTGARLLRHPAGQYPTRHLRVVEPHVTMQRTLRDDLTAARAARLHHPKDTA